MTRVYGAHPDVVARGFRPDWSEYMHYLYLPVVMPGMGDEIMLPPRLEFLRSAIELVIEREEFVSMDDPRHIYVTARRGYATPGNPLNRPGWHSDGFGTDDVNYIWADRWPTLFAVGDFDSKTISTDHIRSAEQFEDRVANWNRPDGVLVYQGEENAVYRLDPSVIHAAPEIPAPGGERSFLKISVSPDRYNLRGNSHNHLFHYSWHMWSREEVRNDPAYAGGDAGPQTPVETPSQESGT